MDTYVSLLKEKEIRVTPQRLFILKFLDQHRTHPSADAIYSALKQNHPSLSRTTVYNSLERLKEHGIVQALTVSGSELHYDFRTAVHHHFLCKECGRIIDIDIECPNIGRIMKMGHHIDEVHGYFKGTCKECMKQEH